MFCLSVEPTFLRNPGYFHKRCEPSPASWFDRITIQLSIIQMQNDSRCISVYGILSDLYHCTFPFLFRKSFQKSDYILQNKSCFSLKHHRKHWQCTTCLLQSKAILFWHGSCKIRHLLTLLHTPFSELDDKVENASSGLGWLDRLVTVIIHGSGFRWKWLMWLIIVVRQKSCPISVSQQVY